MRIRRRSFPLVALVVLMVVTSGCSILEVQTWFRVRGHNVTLQDAKTIADQVNAKLPPGCDKNYVGACIPDNQSEVHCSNALGGPGPAVGEAKIVAWDHYGLDGDGDHVACNGVPPLVRIDTAVPRVSDIVVTGWAIDPDAADVVTVRMTVDGALAATIAADGERPDLAHIGRGTNHGYSIAVPVTPGSHRICAEAVNIAGGADASICRTVSLGAPPPAIPPTGPTTTTKPTTTTTTTTRPTTTTTTLPPVPPTSGGTSFAYVADTTARVIRRIDTATLAVVATYDVGGALGGSIATDGRYLYYLASQSPSLPTLGRYDTLTGRNDRWYAVGADGGLLFWSPNAPGRVFVGREGTSPAAVGVFDVTGDNGVQIAKTPHISIGGTFADLDVSADGTRVWVACGGKYEITELWASDLTPTGRVFDTGPYPNTVTATSAGGREMIAAGASRDQVYLFPADDPSAVTTMPAEDSVVTRSLDFSRDGSRLYAVSGASSPERSELVTYELTTGVTRRAALGTDSHPLMGEVQVDPATGRVFAVVDTQIVIYNSDGTLGARLPANGARSIEFASVGPTPVPPRLGVTPTNAAPPVVARFGATRTSGPAPLTAAFRWDVSDPDGNALTCGLDFGDFESVLIRNCTSEMLRSASYDRPGTPTARLHVSDGTTTVSRSIDFRVGAESTDRFDITVRPSAGMTQSQIDDFSWATSVWLGTIKGGLPDTSFSVPAGACADGAPAFSGAVDDLVIDAIVTDIDGPGGILGSAGPCVVRTVGGLPAYGVMMFDSADVAELEEYDLFKEVVTHEMGHVLGFGTVWTPSVLSGGGTTNPVFTGVVARGAWNDYGYDPQSVPVENTGGPGTADSHWRESVLGSELMTGYLDPGRNPLTRVTAGSLADIGYAVSLTSNGYAFPGVTPNMAASRAATSAGPDLDDLETNVLFPRFRTP